MIHAMAWIAIAILAVSHWLQVIKIHKHKEVRDLSIWTYICLLLGYFALATKAMIDVVSGTGDIVWFFRQIGTIVPVSIVVWQIIYHRKDRYHDDDYPHCKNCNAELEPQWTYCPECSYFTKEEE